VEVGGGVGHHLVGADPGGPIVGGVGGVDVERVEVAGEVSVVVPYHVEAPVWRHRYPRFHLVAGPRGVMRHPRGCSPVDVAVGGADEVDVVLAVAPVGPHGYEGAGGLAGGGGRYCVQTPARSRHGVHGRDGCGGGIGVGEAHTTVGGAGHGDGATWN